MLPASNRGAGTNIGFPDPCSTPVGPAVVPIPYPNMGMNAQATGFSAVVKVSGVNALNMGSSISMTSGDEAGVAHPMVKSKGAWSMGNPLVSIDKMPAINMACPSNGNNMNNGLGAQLVPSVVNVTYCRGHSEDRIDGASIRRCRELPGQVLYLQLSQIGIGVARAVFAKARDARALLLDLRSNPGGSLDDAIDLASLFLPASAPIARLCEHDGEHTTHLSRGRAGFTGPLVLMIDGGTASAAELVAACLQDHDRALCLGRRSFGKRSGYQLALHGEHRLLAVDTLTWERPVPTKRAGVTPDVPAGTSDAALIKHAWALALQLIG